MSFFSNFYDLVMLKNLSQTAVDLIDYCLSEGRICPKREFWDQLCYIYRDAVPRVPSNKHRKRIPVLTPDSPFAEKFHKSMKLRIFITHADKHQDIELVDKLIRSLSKEDWHYFGDYRKLI
jgi:hypothetical protein